MPGIDHKSTAVPDAATDAGLGDSEAGPGAVSGEVAGAMKSGGESDGDSYPAPREKADGDHDGQSEQGYSGGANPNATSTREASHDRAA